MISEKVVGKTSCRGNSCHFFQHYTHIYINIELICDHVIEKKNRSMLQPSTPGAIRATPAVPGAGGGLAGDCGARGGANVISASPNASTLAQRGWIMTRYQIALTERVKARRRGSRLTQPCASVVTRGLLLDVIDDRAADGRREERHRQHPIDGSH